MTAGQKLARNPLFWIGLVMLLWIINGQLRISERIGDSLERQDHAMKMRNDPVYAENTRVNEIQRQWYWDIDHMTYREQFTAIGNARKRGLDIENMDPCLKAIRTYGKTPDTYIACMVDHMRASPGAIVMILNKVERDGWPPLNPTGKETTLTLWVNASCSELGENDRPGMGQFNCWSFMQAMK